LTKLLIARGARVIGVARHLGRLKEMEGQYRGQFFGIEADLGDRAAPKRIVSQILAQFPETSVLINNAAVQHELELLNTCPDRLTQLSREEVMLNLEAPIELCMRFLPHFAAGPLGLIVNVTTGLALAPKAASPVYCATKAGLRSFTRTLRYQCERGASTVSVVEVIMALTATDMTRGRSEGALRAAEAARQTMAGLERGRRDIWIGRSWLLPILLRVAPERAYALLR
jgi:uncharacterized oxidoreductase